MAYNRLERVDDSTGRPVSVTASLQCRADRYTPHRWRTLGARAAQSLCAVISREADGSGRPTAGCRGELDGTVVCAGETIGDRESETGPPFTGRKEGLECLSRVLRAQTGAGIDDTDDKRSVLFLDHHVYVTPDADRVDRIQEQVQEHLLQRPRVTGHARWNLASDVPGDGRGTCRGLLRRLDRSVEGNQEIDRFEVPVSHASRRQSTPHGRVEPVDLAERPT